MITSTNPNPLPAVDEKEDVIELIVSEYPELRGDRRRILAVVTAFFPEHEEAVRSEFDQVDQRCREVERRYVARQAARLNEDWHNN